MNDQMRTECLLQNARNATTSTQRRSATKYARARTRRSTSQQRAQRQRSQQQLATTHATRARAGQTKEKRRLFCRRVVASISLAKPALRNNDDALARKNTSAMTVTNGEIVDRRPSNRAAIQAENERTNSTRIALSREHLSHDDARLFRNKHMTRVRLLSNRARQQPNRARQLQR